MELLMLPKDSARRTMFVAEALGAAAATGAGASDAGGAAAGSSAAGGGSAAPAASPSAATTSMSATLESTDGRLLRLPKLRARRTVAAITLIAQIAVVIGRAERRAIHGHPLDDEIILGWHQLCFSPRGQT